MKNKPFHKRLRFALAGLREAWATERSFRTHIVFGVLALITLVVLRPGAEWWALIGLVSALVIGVELINTSIERLTDHLHPDTHPEIKAVKDLAAGAVLVFAITALVIGGLMIWSLFCQ